MRKFTCPKCSLRMRCSDDLVGKHGVCPHCDQKVIVPNVPPSKDNPILGKPEDESAEAVFEQAAKEYRSPAAMPGVSTSFFYTIFVLSNPLFWAVDFFVNSMPRRRR